MIKIANKSKNILREHDSIYYNHVRDKHEHKKRGGLAYIKDEIFVFSFPSQATPKVNTPN